MLTSGRVQDAIGAIGIARCFTYGGYKRRPLYDADVLPMTSMTKEQYMDPTRANTTINHFYEVRQTDRQTDGRTYRLVERESVVVVVTVVDGVLHAETAQAAQSDEDGRREANGGRTPRFHGDVPHPVPQRVQR